jgi:hypothetical protein
VRHLLRHILNMLTALSLVLCVAACAMWVRSHSAHDWLWWTDGRRVVVGVATAGGSVRCYCVTSDGDPSVFYDVAAGLQHVGHRTEQPSFDKSGDQYFVLDWDRALAGFGVARGHWFSSASYTAASVPLGAVALLTAVSPVRLGLRRRAGRVRKRAGLCLTCGYDLTANASGTCPECGTPTPTAVTS